MSAKQSRTVQGSVPCGNPKRFVSRDVVQMSSDRKKARPSGEPEDLQTESEKHLQTLVKKQINTEISLSGQFREHRTFTPATSHAPAVDRLTGLHQYDHYKQVEELDARVDELRHCGLSDEEIVLKMKKDLKEQLELSSSKQGLGVDPAIEEQRLLDIEERIRNKERSLEGTDSFKGALELSRQSRELEKSLAQRQGKDSVIPSSFITEKKFEDSHPDDPVNHIGGILRDVEGKVVRDSRRDRRKRRKVERKKEYYSQFEKSGGPDNMTKGETVSENTHDDSVMVESDTEFIGPLLNKDCHSTQQSETTVSTQNLDLCADTEMQSNSRLTPSRVELTFEGQRCERDERESSGILRANDGVEERVGKRVLSVRRFIPEEDMVRGRLSEEDIKGMEKFRNYEKGTPSKILYVKNLPKTTNEEDLISLFGRFQSDDPGTPDIIFRLLTGRMKGQAFITFPDKDVASKALHFVNGCKLKDHPIIISFGKKQG